MESKHLSRTDKICIPSSILLIGNPLSGEEFVDELFKTNNISEFDILRIRPEDSEGKSNIISIKQIKEARRFISLTPNEQNKALVIYSADLMRLEAANALLKTLEEPPKYSLIVLISQRENLLPTILSRCIKINLSRVSENNRYDIEDIASWPHFKLSAWVEELINEQNQTDFLESFEKYLSKKLPLRNSRAKAIIKEVAQSKRDMRNNVNPKLVIESLILRYKHHVI